MYFCGLFMDSRGCCYELSFSAKHQELCGGREPQAAQGILGVLLSLFGQLKSPSLHVPLGGGWSLSDKLVWVR